MGNEKACILSKLNLAIKNYNKILIVLLKFLIVFLVFWNQFYDSNNVYLMYLIHSNNQLVTFHEAILKIR